MRRGTKSVHACLSWRPLLADARRDFTHIRALRAMAQRLVHQHQRDHRFGDGCSTNAYARIVTALAAHRDLLAGEVHAAPGLEDAGSRLQCDRGAHVLAAGDAAENTAGIVREKSARGDLVAVFAAALRNGS